MTTGPIAATSPRRTVAPGSATGTDFATAAKSRWRSGLHPALLVAAIFLGVGIAVGGFALRNFFVPKRFGVVVPGEIYRSGQISRNLIGGVLDRHRIGVVIDLNGLDPRDADQQVEAAVSNAKGLRHYRFPLRGNGTGDIERYASAIEVMVESQRRGIPVLVHCVAGAQRTGACIAFYRLLVRNDPPADVYAELMRYGWNPKTDQDLLDYVNSQMGELARLLVERQVLERVPDPLPRLHE